MPGGVVARVAERRWLAVGTSVGREDAKAGLAVVALTLVAAPACWAAGGPR
jgi:hypothetical protein